jgi:hypothetical protein
MTPARPSPHRLDPGGATIVIAMTGLREQERQRAFNEGRWQEVPGYFRPRTWDEVPEGDCLLWDHHEMGFRAAHCGQVSTKGSYAFVVFRPGTGQKITDLTSLRFPLPAPKSGE